MPTTTTTTPMTPTTPDATVQPLGWHIANDKSMQRTSAESWFFSGDGVANFTQITSTTVRLCCWNSELKYAAVTVKAVTAETAVAVCCVSWKYSILQQGLQRNRRRPKACLKQKVWQLECLWMCRSHNAWTRWSARTVSGVILFSIRSVSAERGFVTLY